MEQMIVLELSNVVALDSSKIPQMQVRLVHKAQQLSMKRYGYTKVKAIETVTTQL